MFAMKVTQFQRRVNASTHSIEGSFQAMREHLPPDVQCAVHECRFQSQGVAKRICNIVEAPLHQGDVNHITGDVNYVSYLLDPSRTILTIHDCVFFRNPSPLRRQVIRSLWFQLPASRARVLTAVSEYTRQSLIREFGWTRRRIEVIPTCVLNDYQPKAKEFDGERPTILQVGTGLNKNVERVCFAIQDIPHRLVIVGRLSDRQADLLRRLGIVYSCKAGLSNAQMVQAYEQSDVVVFASEYEGFGMPIVEANRVGRPVVTSNVASMPEVAADAACIVDPFDPASIRDGLLRIIRDSDYRRQLVELGKINAERFTAKRVAAMYTSLYREIAG